MAPRTVARLPGTAISPCSQHPGMLCCALAMGIASVAGSAVRMSAVATGGLVSMIACEARPGGVEAGALQASLRSWPLARGIEMLRHVDDGLMANGVRCTSCARAYAAAIYAHLPLSWSGVADKASCIWARRSASGVVATLLSLLHW